MWPNNSAIYCIEIFHIFINKKRLLLYFYENNIISKQSFQEEIINLYDEIDFLQYFCIELRQLNSKEFEYRIEMNCFKDFIEENDIEYLFICGDLYEQEYIRESSIRFLNDLFEISSFWIYLIIYLFNDN